MEKLLLYCTKATPYLVKDEDCLNNPYYTHSSEQGSCGDTFNGKIVAECDCEKVEEIAYTRTISNIRNGYQYGNVNNFYTNSLSLKDEFQIKTCLSESELMSYFKPKNHRYEKCGYALHLKNLKIFDEPKELSECELQVSEIDYDTLSCDSCTMFKKDCKECYHHYEVKELCKAPQNMCYVWFKGQKYILLPIKPQYLVHILNGEKTIEVRRKILNSLKELIR